MTLGSLGRPLVGTRNRHGLPKVPSIAPVYIRVQPQNARLSGCLMSPIAFLGNFLSTRKKSVDLRKHVVCKARNTKLTIVIGVRCRKMRAESFASQSLTFF